MEIASLTVSLLGLMASLWAAYEVNQLRSRFTRKAKMPEYLAELEAHASKLSACLNDYPDQKLEAAGEVRELDATLEAIVRIQTRGNRSAALDVRRFIQQTGEVSAEQQVQTVYERVRRLKRQLDYQAGEEQWT